MKHLLGAFAAAGLATFASVAAAQAPAPTELRFGNEPWRLVLSLGDFKPIEGAKSTPDRQVFTYRSEDLMNVSVIVENVHAPATMASCRDVFSQRKSHGVAGMPTLNETQGQRGEAATQEFDVTFDFQGRSLIQHNAYTCRIRGTYYIDVHASKMNYLPSDHDALMALIDGVTIAD